MIKKLLLAVAIALPMLASAQSLKIGLVDANVVVEAMPETTQAKNELTQKQEAYQKQGQALEAEMQTKYAEFQKLDEKTPQAIKDMKLRELQDQDQKLQLFQQQAQQDLQKQYAELMQPIMLKVKSAIESVGKENNFSLIQDKNEQITYYFASPVEDITNLVKAKLGLK